MAGAQMMMLGAAGLPAIGRPAINTGFRGKLYNTSTASGTRNVSLNLLADGTATVSRSPTGGAQGPSLNQSNWVIAAPNAGAGPAYSVRFTIVNPLDLTVVSGSLGVWLPLSAGQSLTLRNVTTVANGTGLLTLEFSADGGLTIDKTLTEAFDISVGCIFF